MEGDCHHVVTEVSYSSWHLTEKVPVALWEKEAKINMGKNIRSEPWKPNHMFLTRCSFLDIMIQKLKCNTKQEWGQAATLIFSLLWCDWCRLKF